MNSKSEFGGNPIPRITIENKHEEKKRLEIERNRDEELSKTPDPEQNNHEDLTSDEHANKKRKKLIRHLESQQGPDEQGGVLDDHDDHQVTQHETNPEAPGCSTWDRATAIDHSLKDGWTQVGIRNWTCVNIQKAKHSMFLKADTNGLENRTKNPTPVLSKLTPDKLSVSVKRKA